MVAHELGYWLQQFLNACTLASFYVPLAVAFALVQGLTNKIFLSFGDFAMYAAFAAIYAGLASQLAGNNTATILAVSLTLADLSSAALGHFAQRIRDRGRLVAHRGRTVDHEDRADRRSR